MVQVISKRHQKKDEMRKMKCMLLFGLLLLLLFGFLVWEKQRMDFTRTPTQQQPQQQEEEEKIVIYSVARRDQSGAEVQNQLMAHAYAFSKNQSFGGACLLQPIQHEAVTRQLVQSLGLNSLVKYSCPPLHGHNNNNNNNNNNDRHYKILPDQVFRQMDTRIFSPQWFQYIRNEILPHTILSQRQQQQRNNNKTNRHELSVVIHIRRGLVEPCDTQRYLPNAHYQRVLRKYVLESPSYNNKHNNKLGGEKDKKIIVKIHSQRRSYEPWDPTTTATAAYWIDPILYHDQNNISFSLHLNAPLNDTWYDMMTADILITSRSSFSLVPALLNLDALEIIYTPFWHQPLPHWTTVSDDLLQQTEKELKQLQLECLRK